MSSKLATVLSIIAKAEQEPHLADESWTVLTRNNEVVEMYFYNFTACNINYHNATGTETYFLRKSLKLILSLL